MECTGEIAIRSGQPPLGLPNIRFPGQYFDAETGLHYNRFRYYDPSIGRYISADPIGQFGSVALAGATPNLFMQPDGVAAQLPDLLAAGPNLYSYVSNDPVGAIDPLGLFDFTDVPNVPRGVSDFAAGFGDSLTSGFGLAGLVGLPSATEYAREQTGANDVVDPCSGSYSAGEAAAAAWAAATGGLGAARAAGWTSRVAVHGPHHTFGRLGRLSHVQVNVWKAGAKGSGRAVRAPLPWR